MQSRSVISKLNKILFPSPKYQTNLRSAFPFTSSGAGDREHETDDAMTQGVDTNGETGDPKPDDDGNDRNNIIPTRKDDHYTHPKTVPPNLSSSKLETPGVNTPFDPHVQQKRTRSTFRNNDLNLNLNLNSNSSVFDGSRGVNKQFDSQVQQKRTRSRFRNEDLNLTCAGLDGSPWPDDEKSGTTSSRKEQEEDDKRYFEHHKASPLSEIEIVDSRKPVTQVNQGTAGGYFGDEQVVTWKPGQLDTAEESLRRATEMFREAAARGVPEWPHSRRLRELRGEDW